MAGTKYSTKTRTSQAYSPPTATANICSISLLEPPVSAQFSATSRNCQNRTKLSAHPLGHLHPSLFSPLFFLLLVPSSLSFPLLVPYLTP